MMPAETRLDAQSRVAKHSSATVEHYTPEAVIHAAHTTMGAIDLDPASCAQANDEVVRATKYLTAEQDGLTYAWNGRVWLNPPGGKDERARSRTKTWWCKLCDEYLSGRVTQALFLAFNVEFLQVSQAGCPIAAMALPFCIPSKRLCFFYVEAGTKRLKVGGGPTHANAIVYLPDREDPASVTRFHTVFAPIGACK
jgi:ParB family transcriptional regulator, chromosome partitioning protein